MKHSLVRDTIVQTASRLFYEQGYNLTGINEIIREAGIAKATLYSHFRSKEDICIAYLKFRNETFIKDIEEYCRKKPAGKEQVLGVFGFLEEFYDDEGFNGCWCMNTVSELPRDNGKIREEIQFQKNAFLALIEKLIQKNFSDRKGETISILARHIYLLYEGAISESHLHQKSWPIQSAKELAKQILG
ncbi:MAG: TetR/AcrR family transcriptional regulator [Bacteroidota bacterium]